MMMVWLKATCIADEYAPPTTVGQDSGPDAITLAGMIHDENPFIDSPDQRDPIRRFRGRLTAPVTIVTVTPRLFGSIDRCVSAVQPTSLLPQETLARTVYPRRQRLYFATARECSKSSKPAQPNPLPDYAWSFSWRAANAARRSSSR